MLTCESFQCSIKLSFLFYLYRIILTIEKFIQILITQPNFTNIIIRTEDIVVHAERVSIIMIIMFVRTCTVLLIMEN